MQGNLLQIFIGAVFLIADHNTKAPFFYNNADSLITSRIRVKISNGQLHRKIAFILLLVGSIFFYRFFQAQNPPLYASVKWFTLSFWCVLIVTSLVWSSNFSQSLRKLVPYLSVLMSGILISLIISTEDILLLIRAVSGFFLLAGLANELFKKTFLKRWNYRFAGTLHPNQQGLNCSLLFLSTLELINENKAQGVIILCVAAVGMLGSKSRSAFVSLCIALVWYFLIHVLPNHSVWIVAAFFSIAIFGIIVFLQSPFEFKSSQSVSNRWYPRYMLWRRTDQLKTLTGRTELWKQIKFDCARHYILGFGHGAYWTSDRFDHIHKKTRWRFTDSHSAYLEAMTATGIVGALTYFLLCLSFFISTLAYIGHDVSFSSAFFLLVMVQGILESTFILPNYFTFLFFLLLGNALSF